MKRLTLTFAIVLGISLCAFAQNGGLFGMGPQRDSYENQYEESRTGGLLNLPNNHGETNDVQAPLGSGALLLVGFGAAYALKKGKK